MKHIPKTELEKRLEIIRAKLDEKGAHSSGVSVISTRSSKETMEPSFAQQRMWFLDRFEPESAHYNIGRAFRFGGKLELNRFEKALNQLLKRQQSLRTYFADHQGLPLVEIEKEYAPVIGVVDLSGGPVQAREKSLQEALIEEFSIPFDLARGPLWRIKIWRSDEHDQILQFTFHHILVDAWSLSIFFRELSALYNADLNNRDADLPKLPIQYADYAEWQHDELHSGTLAKQLVYWKKQLSGELIPIELAADRPRPTKPSYRGGEIRFTIPASVASGLKRIGRGAGATLYMVLLASFKVLLYRYTGQEDLSVGSPIAGRTRPDLESLIGLFVNTLVLRTNLRDRPSFLELLRRVRETALAAYAHQELPIEKIVEVLQPERNLSGNPLFQVMFAMRNMPGERLQLGTTEATPLELRLGKEPFDLTLTLRETGGVIEGNFEYALDLFNADRVERMAAHYRCLLEGIVSNPECGITRLPLLPAAERQQLLVDWNDTATDYPSTATVQAIFEAQVARSPTATAMVYRTEATTYDELNRQANRLAHALISRGLQAGSSVGLCVERGPLLLIGLVGILKAGGAYVPLDPAYPAERLGFMLEDTGASILLTQAHLQNGLPHANSEVFCLDGSEATWWQDHPEHNPDPRSGPEEPVYVIYTSGSTGRPKGVEIPHRGVLRLLFGVDYVPLNAEQVFLQLAPISFDASTFEIWAALLHGARCVIFPDRVPSVQALDQIIRQQNISILWLTSSLFNTIVDEPEDTLSGVTHVLTGGESLSPIHVRKALERWSQVELINCYGPTESTTFTSCYRIPRPLITGMYGVLIGRPIANTNVYILDPNMQPVPIGVPGELYIGGDGIARSYLNRPKLTAEKFIANPFSDKSGDRLYKTGDRVRYQPDGNIEFLGRFDHQVKIRGYRIELGEIEAVLNQHAAVQQAIVAVRDDSPGDKRLVAYLVPAQQGLAVAELREYLHSKLPEYMLPSAFVELEHFPLTPNGKLDHRALPAPETGRSNLSSGYKAPSTPIEVIVSRLWSELLGIERVGADDNFFELGGHSLLATQVVSRINHLFGIRLPLSRLFESPRIEALAEEITYAQRTGSKSALSQIKRVSRTNGPLSTDHRALLMQRMKQKGTNSSGFQTLKPRDVFSPVPLAPAQERLWLLEQLNPGSGLYNMMEQIRLHGMLDPEVLERSLATIVQRHESLRTVIKLQRGAPVQEIESEPKFQLGYVDLSKHTPERIEAELRRLIDKEESRIFDLAKGPLFRAKLVKLAAQQHVLLLSQHHLICDGWSYTVIHRELEQLYTAYKSGQASPLKELDVQYADYGLWQQKSLKQGELRGQLDYWQDRLRGAELLEIPCDAMRPAIQDYSGDAEVLVLSEALTRSIKEFCRERQITLFTLLLSVLDLLLFRLSGQSDVVVGCPIAGRNQSDTERLIGFFLNTLVLRSDLSGDPTFSKLITRQKEVLIGAYTNQDVPFDKVVEILQPERDLSRNPLFDVMLNVSEIAWDAFALPGLDVEVIDSAASWAKFPITLYVRGWQSAMTLRLVYQTALFSKQRMNSFLEQYRTLLEQVVKFPDSEISGYSLLSPALKSRLPDPANTLQGSPCVPVTQLFEDWARADPTATAVSNGRQAWSYGQLEKSSRSIAQALKVKGLTSGDTVAVSGGRSYGLIAAILGVLRSGGVLLTLDRELPAERKRVMLHEASVKWLLLMGESEPEDIHPVSSIETIRINPDDGGIFQSASSSLAQHPLPGPDDGDSAYVFFTSGTTGVPKGILGNHRGLSHFIAWQRRTFLPQPGERTALLTALSFDVVLRDLFLPLTSGGVLCLPQDDDLANVLSWLERERINYVHTVPTLLAHWIKSSATQLDLRHLKCLFLAGEPLSAELVKRWRAVFSGTQMINLYGPTETTLAKCWYEVTEPPIDGIQPLGRPLPQTQVLILNQRMELCGIGERGEITIRTPYRSNGYINNAAENKKRFVRNPHTDDPDDILFKTGDLGRYLPDGKVQIAGREDDQVKIRGVRIEPAEISAIMQTHALVDNCAVMLRKEPDGAYCLVAYVASQQIDQLSPQVLRDFLFHHLPSPMIPAQYAFMDELPLAGNGKLDRRALLALKEICFTADTDHVPPNTPLEQVIAAIWSSVLNVESPGVKDNFFDLGGHSLTATQVVGEINQIFQVQLPLRRLFEFPSIEGLAGELQRQSEGQGNLDDIARTWQEILTEAVH